jgi:hypothetical protein
MGFLAALPHAAVLDLGGASQGSIDHLAGPGRRLYTEDALRSLAEAVEAGRSVDAYLTTNIAYPSATFDAILCWDIFGSAPPPFRVSLAARLHDLLRPAGRALAFLPASIAAARRPPGRFEIVGAGLLRRREVASLFAESHLLSRRDIDKLFQSGFEITDFFTAEAFHELLLVRRTRA